MESLKDKILSVSEFVSLLNVGLRSSRVKITGEISQLTKASSGHVYFTLKDEKENSVINSIIWRSTYHMYGLKLADGMKVILQGYPEVYAPSGKLSFIAEVVELAGEGELKKQYEELKKKLTQEGLFAEERKRPIPKYPGRIGVITSKQGAVLADFLNNLGKFGFKIEMIDSRVEGQEAVGDLLASVRTFAKRDIEVLVIIRGGGSFESLMPFNNENLVREVADFKVPVIVGVGHHRDEPLITFAADLTVSTPTAVANYLNQPWEEAVLLLERQEREILAGYQEIFDNFKAVENKLRGSLENFKNSLSLTAAKLEDLLEKSFSGFEDFLFKISQTLAHSEKIILFNDPARQLKLGYSIATVSGKIVRRVRDVRVGGKMDLEVSDGQISSEVKNIKNK